MHYIHTDLVGEEVSYRVQSHMSQQRDTILKLERELEEARRRGKREPEERDAGHRKPEAEYERQVRGVRGGRDVGALQGLEEKYEELRAAHKALKRDHYEATQQLELLREQLGCCTCDRTAVAAATHEHAGIAESGTLDSDDVGDLAGFTEEAGAVVLETAQKCLHEIQRCNVIIHEQMAKVIEAADAERISPKCWYQWRTAGGRGRQELQLEEHKSKRSLAGIIEEVHVAVGADSTLCLPEFDIPNADVVIKFRVDSLHDVDRLTVDILQLCSWWQTKLGPEAFVTRAREAPEPWLSGATQIMHQLRRVCEQYVESAGIDITPAVGDLTRLCATKKIFSPAALALLERMDAPTDVWVIPATKK